MTTQSTQYAGTGEQPWFVINATDEVYQYSPNIPGISQIYRFQAGERSDATFAIPDGCVDIMFDCSEFTPEAKICGSTLSAENAKLKKGHYYFGVRFAPGALLKSLDVSAKQLISQRLDLFDITQDDQCLLEQLVLNKDFYQQAQIIEKYFLQETLVTPSSKTQAALEVILHHKGNIQVAQIEEYTGISKRTLQRLFSEELGLSPKAFSRIIRCQSAINLINNASDIKLIELANDLGFSDQPHFMREFKKLISSTPYDYRKQIIKSSYRSKIHLL